MTVVAIIQARMTSSRLPGKVLADICGKSALERMLERIRRAQMIDHVMVATTTNSADDAIARVCQTMNVDAYRGDEHDVLGRYFGAACSVKADSVVRLTADCPMIDPQVVDEIIDLFREGGCDYASNCVNRTYPDGLDAEVFSIESLRRADREADHPFAREHVTPFIRGSHPQFGDGGFVYKGLEFKADFSHVRWTLDTAEDLDRIRELVGLLPENYHWLEALSMATKFPRLLGVPVN